MMKTLKKELKLKIGFRFRSKSYKKPSRPSVQTFMANR